jgi:hypothetical protein
MQWKEFGKRKEDNIMNKRILILGTLYKIKYRNLKDADYDGYCDYTSRTIIIRADNYYKVDDFQRLQNKQLRHEIIHAFLAESGLQCNFEHSTTFGHEETMVDWIAIQFPKLLSVYRELNILN